MIMNHIADQVTGYTNFLSTHYSLQLKAMHAKCFSLPDIAVPVQAHLNTKKLFIITP